MADSSFPCQKRPPDWAELRAQLRQIETAHPNLRLFRIGRSVLGREILALGLGNLKKSALFVGATHGEEWLTALLLTRFAGEFAGAMESGGQLAGLNIRRLMGSKGLIIVPMLNPDGVEIALKGPKSAGPLADSVARMQKKSPGKWQANARGVDLNHNFDAGWPILRAMEIEAGITAPGPTRFGGPHPASEPETRAILHLIAAVRPQRLYAFHSQGEEIFWQYQNIPIPKGKVIAETLASLSGYTLVENGGLASHGGLKDWFIETCRRPGFTIEIGRGENPLPVEDLEPIYARLLPMLAAATFL